MIIKNHQVELFLETLPEKPYCSDNLAFGVSILPKHIARAKRYVQHNQPWAKAWMVYDVDRSTSIFDWSDCDAPPPNLTVTNLENGHSHLLYHLETPVLLGVNASRKAMRYAAAIDVALTKKLGADPGYTGLLSKNPGHNHWFTQQIQTFSYDLGWLEEYLDLGQMVDLRRKMPEIGLGRNVTLFDRLRSWAYREIRKVWKQPMFGYEFWLSDVSYRAQELNSDFLTPLPPNEVAHTAKSVAKFCWDKLSPQGFVEWQKRQNLRSQAVRKASAMQKWDLVQKALTEHPHASNRDISRLLGIPRQTIDRLRNQFD